MNPIPEIPNNQASRAYSAMIFLLILMIMIIQSHTQEVKGGEEIIPITREVAYLVDQIKTSDELEIRVESINKLIKQKELAVPALPTLAGIIKNEEVPKLRIAAAEAIGKIGVATPITLKALIEGLNDKYDRVRAVSALSLGELGPAAASALPLLIEKTQKDDQYVRSNSLTALGRIAIDPDEVLDHLTKGLEDSSYQCRYAALVALNNYGEKAKSALPALLEYGNRKETSMRARLQFLRTLVSVGKSNPQTLDWLIQQMRSTANIREVFAILNLLGGMGPEARPAASAVKNLLETAKDSRVKAMATQVLQKIESPALD